MRIKEFQQHCWDWAQRCFSQDVVFDKKERCLRFLEEAVELVQACGLSKNETLRIVNYVFSRKVGEPKQETGGVIVTLVVLNSAFNIDTEEAAIEELGRIEDKINKIRIKQSQKPSLRDSDTIVGLTNIKDFLLEHYPERQDVHSIMDGLMQTSVNKETIAFDIRSRSILFEHWPHTMLNLPE